MIRHIALATWLMLLAGSAVAQTEPEASAEPTEPSESAESAEPDTTEAQATDVPDATEAVPDEATDRARALFSEGVEHANARRFPEAVVSFRSALALRSAPAIEYNLARALVEVDEVTEAYELVTQVLAGDAPDGIRRDAEILQRDLRPRVALLSVSVAGGIDAIQIDGRVFSLDELHEPIALMPGSHELVATQADNPISRRQLELRAGVEMVVDLNVVQTPREAAITATPQDDGSSNVGLVVGLVAGAVAIAVVVIVLAVVLGGGTQAPVRGDFEPGVIRW